MFFFLRMRILVPQRTRKPRGWGVIEQAGVCVWRAVAAGFGSGFFVSVFAGFECGSWVSLSDFFQVRKCQEGARVHQHFAGIGKVESVGKPQHVKSFGQVCFEETQCVKVFGAKRESFWPETFFFKRGSRNRFSPNIFFIFLAGVFWF